MVDPTPDQDLEALLQQFQASELTELYVRTGDFQLFLSREPQAVAPWTAAVRPAEPRSEPAATEARQEQPSGPVLEVSPQVPAQREIPDGHDVVRAPYLGTFYRSPKPGAAHFVEIGAAVKSGDDLCLIEVMKLFTAVKAPGTGIVRHIYATDGQMVQAGEPLFALEPVG